MKCNIGHFKFWQMQYKRHKYKDGQTCICGTKNQIWGPSTPKEGSSPLNWKGSLWGCCHVWFVFTRGWQNFSRLAPIQWTPGCNINQFMLINLRENWNGHFSLLGLECYFWWSKARWIVPFPPSGKYIGANVGVGFAWTVHLHFCLTFTSLYEYV